MALTISLTDTRLADGRLIVTAAAVPTDLNREEIGQLAHRVGAAVREQLGKTALPALVTEATLREAVKRGTLTGPVARSLLSLQDELGTPTGRV